MTEIKGLQSEQTEITPIRRADRSLLAALRPFSNKGSLSVIEFLANTEDTMPAAEIIKETGLPSSTFFKFTSNLGHLNVVSSHGELVPGMTDKTLAGNNYILTNLGSDLLSFVIDLGTTALDYRDELILDHIRGYDFPERILGRIKDDLLLEREYLDRARIVPRFLLKPLNNLTVGPKMGIAERLLASSDPLTPRDLMELEGIASSTFFKYANELRTANITTSDGTTYSLSPFGRQMATKIIDYGEVYQVDSKIDDAIQLSRIYRELSEEKKQQIRQILMETES